MLKVLLVHPEESRTKYDFKGIIENECLDLEWIQAILEKHSYEVIIFDKQVEEISFKDFIEDNTFDVFYGEARCFQESFIMEYALDFKNKYNGLTIIGGLHAQICKERYYQDYIDIVLSGYNYMDIPLIIEGNREIKNISFKKEGEWIETDNEAIDINDMPLPNRTYFYNHPNNYRYLDLKHALWIRSSFSCPYRCSFCIRNKMNNNKYSRRNVLSFVDEIENNDNEVVYIVDDDFLIDENYLKRFIEEIKNRKIKRKYICYGRTDFVSKHEDIMASLKEIGLSYLLVGLEDINDYKLNSYFKDNNVSNNEKCIEICHKYDIRIMAMFILGLDYVGKDFKNLYSYIKKHNLKHVAVSIYTPELGLDNNIEYITDDPSHFDYLHLVCKPLNISVRRYYFHYYILLIKLFLKGKREGVYDFIDYYDYINSFIKNIFKKGKENA